MDIEGYLYSGVSRVGTFSNPIYVTFSATPPSEHPGGDIEHPDKEVVPTPEIKVVYKEVPYYNIKGDGILFRSWMWIGKKMGWIDGR